VRGGPQEHKKGSTDRPPHADLPSCVLLIRLSAANHSSAVSPRICSRVFAGPQRHLPALCSAAHTAQRVASAALRKTHRRDKSPSLRPGTDTRALPDAEFKNRRGKAG
jgi:hypothetical protein